MRFPAEYTFECCAKLGAKDGVNNGVKGRIEIAQPQKKADQCLIKMVDSKYGHKNGQDKKWQPACDESSGDNGQCFRSLPFTFGLKRHVLFVGAIILRLLLLLQLLLRLLLMEWLELFTATGRLIVQCSVSLMIHTST